MYTKFKDDIFGLKTAEYDEECKGYIFRLIYIEEDK